MADDTKKADLEGEFVVLTVHDRLNMARDFLRGRETDAYRTYLARISAPSDQPVAAEAEFDDALTALRAEVRRLEKEAAPNVAS